MVLQAEIKKNIKWFLGKILNKGDSRYFRPFKVFQAEELKTFPQEIVVGDFLVIHKTHYSCVDGFTFKELLEIFYRIKFFFAMAGKQYPRRSCRGKIMYAFVPFYLP